MNWVLAVVWLVSGRCAYLLFRWSWRQDFDFNRSDRRTMTILSICGPISLLTALIIVLLTVEDEGGREVLLPRFDEERHR